MTSNVDGTNILLGNLDDTNIVLSKLDRTKIYCLTSIVMAVTLNQILITPILNVS